MAESINKTEVFRVKDPVSDIYVFEVFQAGNTKKDIEVRIIKIIFQGNSKIEGIRDTGLIRFILVRKVKIFGIGRLGNFVLQVEKTLNIPERIVLINLFIGEVVVVEAVDDVFEVLEVFFEVAFNVLSNAEKGLLEEVVLGVKKSLNVVDVINVEKEV